MSETDGGRAKTDSGQMLALVEQAVENSRPDMRRPRMTEANELKLKDTDEAKATCYAALEVASQRLATIREGLVDESSDAIPIEIGVEDDEDESSLVTSIDAVIKSATVPTPE